MSNRELIERARWLLSGDREVYQRYPYEEIVSPLMECLAEAADALEQMEWVSVEERLPGRFEQVLVVTRLGRVGTDARNKVLGSDVTHWMPLPTPPGESP